jgi:hypothetical protein
LITDKTEAQNAIGGEISHLNVIFKGLLPKVDTDKFSLAASNSKIKSESSLL